MESKDDSLLPRILGIFYAVMDPSQDGGTKVLYQVPANLISTKSLHQSSTSSNWYANEGGGGGSSATRSHSLVRSPMASSTTTSSTTATALPSRAVSPGPYASSPFPSNPPPTASNLASTSSGFSAPKLAFQPIAPLVIPHETFCEKLITITSGPYKIQGYPVVHSDRDRKEKKYHRNTFRWNVCWVFDRWKYEGGEFDSVVRKVGRVLAQCEEEFSFLSAGETQNKIHQILEQLYEDLNSYAETSIPIDDSNSIEIKIFPVLKDPFIVKSCDVPLPLIDLAKMKEPNWDTSMRRIVRHIDGVRHIRKLAEMSDVGVQNAVQCIRHLLYYDSCMLVDLFQYSNMYTVMPAIMQAAEYDHVVLECANYCMRPSDGVTPTQPLSWPKLLKLYSAMRPGRTVSEWMVANDVAGLRIDVRRFVQFGVIKRFLRRVQRWPLFRPVNDLGHHVYHGGSHRKQGSISSNPEVEAGFSGFSTASTGESLRSQRSPKSGGEGLLISHGGAGAMPSQYQQNQQQQDPQRRPYRQNTTGHQFNHTSEVTGASLYPMPTALQLTQQPTSARRLATVAPSSPSVSSSLHVPPSLSLADEMGGYHRGHHYNHAGAVTGNGGGSGDQGQTPRSTQRQQRRRRTNRPSAAGTREGGGIGGGSTRGGGGMAATAALEGDPDDPTDWGELGFPSRMRMEWLNGNFHEDFISVELGLGWGGERGLGKALEAFARAHHGVVEIVLR